MRAKIAPISRICPNQPLDAKPIHIIPRDSLCSRVCSMLAQAMYVICRQLRLPWSYQTRIENRNRDRHRPPGNFRRVIADVSANAMLIF